MGLTGVANRIEPFGGSWNFFQPQWKQLRRAHETWDITPMTFLCHRLLVSSDDNATQRNRYSIQILSVGHNTKINECILHQGLSLIWLLVAIP